MNWEPYRAIHEQLYGLYQAGTLERAVYERLRSEAARALDFLTPDERADLLGDLDALVPLEWAAKHSSFAAYALERRAGKRKG